MRLALANDIDVNGKEWSCKEGLTSPTPKYGAYWSTNDPLSIEMSCIQKNGRWKEHGKVCGEGLFYHYKAMQKLLWPEDDYHRWSDIILKTIVENDIVVLMGPGDSGKTYQLIKYALPDFWCFPDETLTLISSTDIRGLELRIWGWLKILFNRAKERYPHLAGKVLENQHAITFAQIDDTGELGRELNKGLVCIPCVSGGQYVGMGKFVGMKQKRLRHIGDEVQFMKSPFLDAYSNWYGKENFKGLMAGNPQDPMDPLGRAGEPIEGWTGAPIPDKTTTWRTRFFDGICLNLVGTDSPNFDYPKNEALRFPYLINWRKFEAVEKTYGKDHPQYVSQCEGVMRPGLVGYRIITRELCRQHKAFEKAVWDGNHAHVQILACDPAYGGGDRCVAMRGEFGLDVDQVQILKLYPPEVIPISVKISTIPEMQIADWIYERARSLGLSVDNIFYDSFGKGTIGFSFAQVFGSATPNPVDSGAKCTKRPVRYDLYQSDGRTRRLKRCDEHYSKFVTEMWYSVREAIESEQVRELPEDVMQEGCLRQYSMVSGGKIEVEPKADMKERTGYSPDLFDTLAVLLEGARQRGFQIKRLGPVTVNEDGDNWFEEMKEKRRKLTRSYALEYAA